jgi:peptidoglycan/xylan/chitin deacetylase (PgdA/CDA1 family)
VASAAAERVGTSFRSRAQSALKRAAGASDRFRSHAPGIVVLAYHRVGGRSDAREIDLPESRFEEQMACLARWCEPVDLDTALVSLQSPDEMACDRVVVTFDDGTADFVDVALPILERYRIPATLYIATDYIEAGRPFPDAGTPLSWTGVRDAISTGLVTIGSHTHSHCLLDRVTANTATIELRRSIDLVFERAGVIAEHFAYPKALSGDASVDDVVRSLFRSAAIAGTRANLYGHTDSYRLARSPIQRSDGMHYFEQKLTGGLRLEDDVRRLVNRVRYRGASS